MQKSKLQTQYEALITEIENPANANDPFLGTLLKLTGYKSASEMRDRFQKLANIKKAK